MFSFLKNWRNKEQNNQRALEEIKRDIQEGTAVEVEKLQENEMELRTSAQEPAAPKQELPKLKTDLSLHPSWEQHLDSEKKYTLRFLQEELPEMYEGTVGVNGFSMIPGDGGVTIAMFVRNASSHPAVFKNVSLSIHLDDKPFARHRFNLTELGEIPPYSSRPWEVFFPDESYLHDNFSFARWKVLLNLGTRLWPKHLDLDPEMEARMTDKQKDRLEELAHSLPPVRENNMEITGFDLGRLEDGSIVAGLLFRSGLRELYHPDKLKLKISDAEGDVIASGTIDASNIRVLPGTSRPWLIVFPPQAVKKANANLRKWYLEVTR